MTQALIQDFNCGGVSRGVGKRSELAIRRVTSVVKEGVFSMQDQGVLFKFRGVWIKHWWSN